MFKRRAATRALGLEFFRHIFKTGGTGDSPSGMAGVNPSRRRICPGGTVLPFRPASRRTAQASGLYYHSILKHALRQSDHGARPPPGGRRRDLCL